MDIITTPPYEELQIIFNKYFTTGYFGYDFTKKVALISLICFLVEKLKEKKPDVTHYQVIKKLAVDFPEDVIKGFAVVCADFGYGCTNFPTFGLEPKQIPAKVKEMFGEWLPF